jgi:hypothetical protein
MKKTISVLVSAVALLAIAMVAFLGTKPVGIVTTVYINSVQILDDESHPIEWRDDHGIAVRRLDVTFKADAYDAQSDTEYMYYVFDTEILPTNATHRSFLYYGANDAYVSFVDSNIKKGPSSSSSSTSAGESQANNTGKVVIKRVKGDSHSDHLVTIYCKADDGGPAGIEDSIDFLILFPNA